MSAREAPCIALETGAGQGRCMTRRPNTQRRLSYLRTLPVLCGLLLLLAVPGCAFGEPAPAAVAAFNSYTGAVESRLAQQHRSSDAFLASLPSAADSERLRRGEFVVVELTPAGKADLPGAMLHHWRGTAFAPGARAADFERLMRDFGGYPKYFSPEVMQAKVVSQDGDCVQAVMRVRQKHVITVVMDTALRHSF